MTSMTMTGVSGLRQLARQLEGAETRTRRRIRAGALAATKPVQKRVQANARAIPVTGQKSTGLREAIAKATEIRILTGGRNTMVRVWVNYAAMPAGQQHLPLLMERGPWRHPVYARGTETRDQWTWVNQASHRYWAPALDAGSVSAAATMAKTLEQIVADIAEGT